jgi:hypothetical protein
MDYIRTKEATGWSRADFQDWRARFLRAVLFFIPNANPDHEKLYPEVSEWLLEIDEKGRPNREIGLDSKGQSLLAAPDEKNFGLWTDSPSILDPQQYDQVTKEEFEEKWRQAEHRT